MWVECVQNKMAKQCDGTTQQSLAAVGKDCCVALLVSLFFMSATTGQHPYMQLVSVLCKPVSSIPTSLSFFLKFLSLFQSFFQLNNSAPT